MCLITTLTNPIKVKEPIEVVKLLTKDRFGYYYSPCIGTSIKFNELMIGVPDIKEMRYPHYLFNTISSGYIHTYTKINKDIDLFSARCFKAIIPEGAYIYMSYDFKEVCASEMIITDESADKVDATSELVSLYFNKEKNSNTLEVVDTNGMSCIPQLILDFNKIDYLKYSYKEIAFLPRLGNSRDLKNILNFNETNHIINNIGFLNACFLYWKQKPIEILNRPIISKLPNSEDYILQIHNQFTVTNKQDYYDAIFFVKP